MTLEKLATILAEHARWLAKAECSRRADLSGVELVNQSLTGLDFRKADMRYAYMPGAVTLFSDFSGADLTGGVMYGADLSKARFKGAKLTGANLANADLSRADLRDADLSGADLSGANLSGAGLSGANLTGALLDRWTAFADLQCPEEGSFIGYTKVNRYIVKLEIPADALRTSATSRLCRCSEAKALSITDLSGDEFGGEISEERGVSLSNSEIVTCQKLTYKVGEMTAVDDFDENRWNEHGGGIPFFMTRGEAVRWE